MIKKFAHKLARRSKFIDNQLHRFNYNRRIKNYEFRKIRKIVVLYFIPKENKQKINDWKDGFTEGIALYQEKYDITWINLSQEHPTIEKINSFDFLLVKSCWGWIVDDFVQNLEGLEIPRGIVVSCSKKPKSKRSLFNYDIVYYQTYWYRKYLKHHPNIVQAFGINANDFYPIECEKDIDFLGIGLLTAYKRFHLFKEKQGKRVVVGAFTASDSLDIKSDLEKNNIECITYVSQSDLNLLINRSKNIYLPCEIDGGGERALLESRSAGTPVIIEDDNPKLSGLLRSPLWTHQHYGKQIFDGIEKLKCNK